MFNSKRMLHPCSEMFMLNHTQNNLTKIPAITEVHACLNLVHKCSWTKPISTRHLLIDVLLVLTQLLYI